MTKIDDGGTPLFSLSDIDFSYRRNKPVLSDLSLDVLRGEFLGILGPNGCGKSTLVSLMTGWRQPQRGSVLYQDRLIEKWSRQVFAREVAVVPQREEGLFPFTAEEVVMMGRYAFRDGFAGAPREDRIIARAALNRVDLGDRCDARLDELSGGERQRVLIARALAQCPKVMILDEPTASLDPGHQTSIFALIADLVEQHDLTVIAVSHDINLAALYCSRIALMKGGRVLTSGAPSAVIEPGVLRDVYGSEFVAMERPDGRPAVGLVR